VTATIKFALPEESEELNLALKAADCMAALQEIDGYLRGRLKFEDLSEDVAASLEAARERLYNAAEARGLKLW